MWAWFWDHVLQNIAEQVKQMGHTDSVATVHQTQHGKGVIRIHVRKQVRVELLPYVLQQLLVKNHNQIKKSVICLNWRIRPH